VVARDRAFSIDCMSVSTPTPDNNTGTTDDQSCDHEWCDGPNGARLPCFDCYTA